MDLRRVALIVLLTTSVSSAQTPAPNPSATPNGAPAPEGNASEARPSGGPKGAIVPPVTIKGGQTPGAALLGQLVATPEAITAGQVVLARGSAGGGPACASCHGPQGMGDPSGAFPRLTAQPAWYLYKQLRDYASGARANAIMSQIAKSMTDEEQRNVAITYAASAAGWYPPAPLDTAHVDRGRTLATLGDDSKRLQACGNCHGPNGSGFGQSFPYLAGQFGPYMESQIKMWQRGFRKNDTDGTMRSIAALLDESDQEAIAAYYSGLRPPGAP